MKKVLFVFPLIFLFAGFTADVESEKISSDCKCKEIPLYGKVKFVTSFPDFKIKYVESFPDLKVKFVGSSPRKCGEWQIVESFPDFTVQVVESFSDFTVKAVESFPGQR